MCAPLPHEVFVLPRLVAGRVLRLLGVLHLRASPLFHLLLNLRVVKHHVAVIIVANDVDDVVDFFHILVISLDLIEVVVPDRRGVLHQTLDSLFVTLL